MVVGTPMATLSITDILLFSEAAGTGREENDKRNKQREFVLVELFKGRCDAFCSDVSHGSAWTALKTEFSAALQHMAALEGLTEATCIKVQQKGGRGFNYDFIMTYKTSAGEHETHVEFKYGGTTVDSLPEFFNPAADKPFHAELYASYYYKTALPQVAALYGITVPLPSEADYVKHIHKNKPSLPFLVALDTAERADADRSATSKYTQKRALVAASIQGYLESTIDSTNFSHIEAELKRSQQKKRYLIYSNNTFHHDALKPEELELEETAYIKNGNTLVIQTKEPGTHISMLLRWKNHLGILFPAWQISMTRA
jgi:hypothetical protein